MIESHRIRLLVLTVALACAMMSLQAAVTVSFRSLPLKQAFKAIEKVSDLKFVYKSDLPDFDRKVSLDVTKAPEKQALDNLFSQTNLSYRLIGNNVVVERSGRNRDKSRNDKIINETKASKKPAVASFLLKGKVTDTNGEPLIGATIMNKNRKTGVSSDAEGNFSLPAVSKGDLLQVSYIGYQPEVIAINSSDDLDIKLKESATMLDEVVAVGFGTQKKVNLTGAVSVVKAKDLNGRPTGNAATALQGADPSLNLTMSSGGPDATASFNIRGVTSINGGTPLVLVDGVEMNLIRLNANDIESVSILKDASASAIYGAKASAGVILVTTKSGKENSAPRISFDLKAGWRNSTTSNDFITSGYWSTYINDLFMSEFQGRSFTTYNDIDRAELWMREGQTVESAERPWTVVDQNGYWRYYANFDWHSYLYRKSRPLQDYNVSISGGSRRVSYFVSGRANIEEGIIKPVNDDFKSFSMRAKLDVKITNWLKYHFNGSMFESTYNEPSATGATGDIFNTANVHNLAAFPATNPDGTSVYELTGIITNGSGQVANGYSAILNYGKHKNKRQNREFLVKNGLDIQILPFWTLNADYSYLFRNFNGYLRTVEVPYSVRPNEELWVDGTIGSRYADAFKRTINNYTTQTINAYTTLNPSFGNHNLKVTAGFNGEIYRYQSVTGSRKDLMSPDVSTFNIATGEITQLKDVINNSVTYGFFARVNYDYAGKYLLELSGRYDGSSRFAKKHRWGFFPSASAGWRFTEEKFLESAHPWLSNGKLRLSIGTLGNQQVGFYDYIQQITPNQQNTGITLDGTNSLPYASVSAPPASDLTWEKVTTYNLGLDLNLFSNRLGITGDVYIRDTKDMLTAGAKLPSTYGTSVPKSNCADLRTKGWELGVSWTDNFILLNSPFTYSVGAGVGDHTSVITKFDNNPSKLLGTHYEGEKIGEIWGYTIDGLFATDEEAAAYEASMRDVRTYCFGRYNQGPVGALRAGDPRFVDINGDGAVNSGEKTADNSGDRTIIGNTTARYNYNIRGSFEWKGIDFSIFFQGVGKRDWYPGSEARMFWGPYCRPYQAFIPSGFMDNVWSEDNPDAYFPRPRGYIALYEDMPLGKANTRYLQSAAYLRLKNLTIGYTLPVLKKYVKEIRVYFSAENLCYWSPLKKYCKYIDPEVATIYTNQWYQGMGYDYPKTFTFGLNLVF